MHFLSLPDARFKTSRLTIALLLPLDNDTAAAQAILPALMQRACAAYPDFSTLQKHLNTLYGASLIGTASRVADFQALMFTTLSMDDRFALQKEAVTAECARLLCEMIFRPALEDGLFREEDVETEKRCLIERIRSEINDKRQYARTNCEKLLCEGQPYAVSPYGTVEQVEALTRKDITAAWKRVLRTAKVRVFCQSSTDGENIRNMMDAEFAAVPDRVPVELLTVPALAPATLREQTETMTVKQSKLVLGYATGICEPDKEIAALRLMNSLLGGTPQSLLFRHVREEMSLCYYCVSSIDRLKGVLLIDSGVEGTNVDKAKNAIAEQIDAIRNGNFSDEELEWARRGLASAFREISDSQPALTSWYLSQSLYHQKQTPEQQAQVIAAVTREQVMDAARKLTPGAVYVLEQEAKV